VTPRGAGGTLLASIALLVAASPPVSAQQPRLAVVPELRIDVLGTDPTSVQGAVGVEIPSGYYVRIGLLVGGGATIESDGESRAAGRVDLLVRFLIDPFRQSRWGFSAGAGVSLRADPGEKARPQILAAVDLEGRRSRGGLSPSLQVGLGGGVRGGIGLRWGGRAAR
jgi:hypothetical protein